MAKCNSCKQESRTRLDANNLCHRCAENAKAAEKEALGVDPDKAVGELTVRELVGIIKKITDPIETKVKAVEKQVEKSAKEIKILQNELHDKSE